MVIESLNNHCSLQLWPSHITANNAVTMQKCQTSPHIARHCANDRQCSPMIGCISFASPSIARA